MLLKNYNYINKFTIMGNINFDLNFFVLNLQNFKYFNLFYSSYNVLHYSTFINYNCFFKLFSGNNYFVFVNFYKFFTDFFFFELNDNFDLLAVCLKGYFMNFANKFFFMSDNFISIFYLFYFYFLFILFLFFFKIMVICLKIYNIMSIKKSIL